MTHSSKFSSRAAILLCLGSFILPAVEAKAQPAMWKRLGRQPENRPAAEVWVKPDRFDGVVLDRAAMQRELARAPKEILPGLMQPGLELSIPMPDGSVQKFRVMESSVMAPELAAKFPEIKTYVGQGIDDPRATARFDLTPAGFHAQILTPSGAVYIDPHFRDQSVYASYYKRDHRRMMDDFRCLGVETNALGARSAVTSTDLSRSGSMLRTYRLACAADGEYTAFHGGTVSAGLAAVVTAVNRVTGVYETELAIRLVLVGNNDLIIYTNSSTDPYSNTSGSTMLTQNQSTLDSVIGSANYDIGHVFSTGGGGIAGLGVVCVGGSKARGVTGNTSPVGDSFWIDYVAHEMGHQFGGNHTFNSSTLNCGGGNRNASTAYEPGSGSTIMAYAGICGSDDLQPHSDPYFHSVSFDEIVAYTTTGSGNGCAVQTPTGNTAPTVSAGPSFTIPASTPFILTASGSDADGDPLTYCWEERDLGASITLATADNGSSPLFRVFNPTSEPWRTFPKLSDILNNATSIGERLPTTSRTMNFRVTARDNRAGGGGVNTSDTSVTVVSTAGPFTVTSQPSGGVFSNSIVVTWNVANTASSPINAANVTISLSTNGGLSFPIILAASTPNDGSQIVALPSLSTSQARLKVQGAGNVFFDINAANFSIIPGTPSPQVVFEGFTLVSEGCGSGNGAIDPGETVTVLATLRNTGSANTTNLVATLTATGGVNSPSAPQNYGALIAGGAAVSLPFTFTASGSCGGSLTLALALADGSIGLETVSQSAPLGGLAPASISFTNATAINLPNSGTKGKASVYPSTISVAGVTGAVSQVRVTLRGLTHSWVGDLDFLLVGPGGQKVLLMSDAGDNSATADAVAGISLTFDDTAASTLSDLSPIVGGTYRPTNIDPAGDSDSFTSPAPAAPYGTALSTFNGLNPNGSWALYIMDDGTQDTGSLSNGWTLSLSYSNSACCAASGPIADLSLGQSVATSTVNLSNQVVLQFAITNLGPDTASAVALSTTLPAGLAFVSATSSLGTITNSAGVVTAALGSLASGQTAACAITVQAVAAGNSTNFASITSGTSDLNSGNNSAAVVLSVNSPPTISAITNQVTGEDIPLVGIAFTINDAETTSSALNVGAFSSDTNLFPTANLVLAGATANRTLSLTPATNLSGTATITISVSDGLATTARNFQVTVNPINDAPQLANIPAQSVIETTSLIFTAIASDVEAPPQTLVFSILGAPAGAHINPTNGAFAWPPDETQGPSTNVFSIVVADNGSPILTATQLVTVVVLESNLPPVLGVIGSRVVHAGATVTFTNTATDPDWPANGLVYTLDSGGPVGASIGPNGIFNWAIPGDFASSTNHFTARVTDDGSPALDAAQSFTITVKPRPLLETVTVTNSAVVLQWTSIAGEHYRVQASAELPATNWIDITSDILATADRTSATNAIDSSGRFFRIRWLSP